MLLLQRSLAALSDGSAVQDVTLSWTARRIAGSLDGSGAVTLEGTAVGQSRIEIDLPSRARSEVRDTSPGRWAGSWSDSNGAWHPIADHSLWTDPTWFMPAFLIARVVSNGDYTISPAGAETLSGVAVQHVLVSQAADGSQPLPSLFQNLSKIDGYLDSQSLLPVAIAFQIHPDNDALRNIRVRIEFSDYRRVQGATVPCHIQKYLQNGLILDLTFTTTIINSGLSSSVFQAP